MLSRVQTLRPLRLARRTGSLIPRRYSFRPAARKALRPAVGVLFATVLIIAIPSSSYSQAGNHSGRSDALDHPVPAGGLREVIPDRYRGRYDRWKATFLSSIVGRRLWLKYVGDPAFRLTIVISKSQGRGAEVTDFLWEGGKLVAATIILGHRLDDGYPCRINYPALGSLAFSRASADEGATDVLAAAKIAHEFGHVEDAANSDATTYQLQNVLSETYRIHFLSNGYNAEDPVLVELAGRLGATPAEITVQREHRAETYALRYLLDKLSYERRRELLRRVRESLTSASRLYSFPLASAWKALAPPG